MSCDLKDGAYNFKICSARLRQSAEPATGISLAVLVALVAVVAGAMLPSGAAEVHGGDDDRLHNGRHRHWSVSSLSEDDRPSRRLTFRTRVRNDTKFSATAAAVFG